MSSHGQIRRIEQCQIDHIAPNPWQPRLRISDKQLAGLVDSIKRFGFASQLEVRRDPQAPDGKPQLVFGHRRLRAAELAGLTTVPVAIVARTDQEMIELAYLENSTQLPLSYWDEALFFGRLQEDFGFSIRDLADQLGVSKGYVQNRRDLLKFPEDSPVRVAMSENAIDLTSALTLLHLSRSLSAAQIEDLVSGLRAKTISGTDLTRMKLDADGRSGSATTIDQNRPVAEEPALQPAPLPPEPPTVAGLPPPSVPNRSGELTPGDTDSRMSPRRDNNTPRIFPCGEDDDALFEAGLFTPDGLDLRTESDGTRAAYLFVHQVSQGLDQVIAAAEVHKQVADFDKLSPDARQTLETIWHRFDQLFEGVLVEE